MIRVILKDGRVLDYNQAENVRKSDDGFIRLIDKGCWYAIFNPDVVERIEYDIQPCQIRKDRRDKKRMKFYT